MITIYVSYTKGLRPYHKLIGGFNSIHEAMAWLVSTYENNADFWSQVTGVKIN